MPPLFDPNRACHLICQTDACAKLRPTAEEITALGPEFQEDWDIEFAKAPTRPLMLCGMVSAFLADPTLVDPGQYITLGTYTAYPFSRGRIHITSTEDVLTGYDFDTGFLNHRADIKKQLWAYKMQRELARRLPYYRGELELGHPKFPASSGAALNSIPIDSEDAKPKSIPGDDRIQYSKEDDELIEDWVRGNLNTTWHSMSTCSMKAREKGGVVDKDLNVYGTTGLKVADLSICPENVGANTNNTALVVGEKAAVIIARELGIEV